MQIDETGRAIEGHTNSDPQLASLSAASSAGNGKPLVYEDQRAYNLEGVSH